MRPEEKILTYEQARELKWFCKNVTGTRLEFYEVFDKVREFGAKLDRLKNTCDLIEKYFEEHPELDPDRILSKETK